MNPSPSRWGGCGGRREAPSCWEPLARLPYASGTPACLAQGLQPRRASQRHSISPVCPSQGALLHRPSGSFPPPGLTHVHKRQVFPCHLLSVQNLQSPESR